MIQAFLLFLAGDPPPGPTHDPGHVEHPPTPFDKYAMPQILRYITWRNKRINGG